MIRDQGAYFVNPLIEELMDEFQIHHRRKNPYHPQENGAVDAFNNILENALQRSGMRKEMTGIRRSL